MEALREYLDYPAVAPVLVLVGGIVGARLLAWVLTGAVRGMTAKTETTLDDEILDIVYRPLVASCILLSTYLAASQVPGQARWRPVFTRVLITLAIFVLTRATVKIVDAILEAIGARSGEGGLIQQSTLPVFHMVGKILLWGAAIYAFFLTWNIDPTAWMASAGVAGVAVGFAAKDTLANLFSGIFIIADAPYKAGDMVVLDGNLRGRVVMIGLRSTRLVTLDGVEITIPNAVIGGAQIVNETGGPSVKQRLSIVVEAAYGSDIDKVHEVLRSVPAEVMNVCKSPPPSVEFTGFGASGLEHTVRVWISAPKHRERVIHDMHTAVYKALAEADLEIPYSKHDLYLKEAPGFRFEKAAE